jgi:hypothetical protein
MKKITTLILLSLTFKNIFTANPVVIDFGGKSQEVTCENAAALKASLEQSLQTNLANHKKLTDEEKAKPSVELRFEITELQKEIDHENSQIITIDTFLKGCTK